MQSSLPLFWRPQFRRQSVSAGGGFTLVELLTVMGIIALMAGLMVPAVSGLGRASELATGARMVSNTLAAARIEAITQRAVIRLAVVTDWPGEASANYRKMSIWRQDPSATEPWQQIGAWTQLPQSVAFEPASPGYVTNSDPANYLLRTATPNSFAMTVRGKVVTMKYVEFLPSGAARLPQSTGSEVWLTMAPGSVANQSLSYTVRKSSGSPVNWAKVSANTLTGRVNVSQP